MVQDAQDYALYSLSPSGHVESWNDGAERLKDYTADEIIGRHFSLFYTPEDRKQGKPQRLLAAAASLGHVTDEGWRVRQDGSRFWAAVIITALRGVGSRLRGFS
jgi:PAS domain S-box-containing protein